MKSYYVAGFGLLALFLMQYSLLYEDVRFTTFRRLFDESRGHWTGLSFPDEEYSWFIALYLQFFAYLLWIPLMIVYMDGPSLWGYGFWLGRSNADICSALTHVDASFWSPGHGANDLKCLQTIFHKVEAFIIFVQLVGVGSLCLCALYWFASQAFYARVIDRMVDQLQKLVPTKFASPKKQQSM